jgi:hypothetical protein
MYRGRIAGEVGAGASAEEIGLLMAGGHPDPVAAAVGDVSPAAEIKEVE